MARPTVTTNQRAYGAAVLDRLAGEPLPSLLKAPAKEFKDQHALVEKASAATEAGRAARDAALEEIASADSTLDASVELLANAVVGAGIGRRTQPFASFTRRKVSELVNLAYATEAKEVRALCTAIRRAKPEPAVLRAVAACEKNVQSVERAITALAKPQAAYAKALASRDALLPVWTRALARLKRHAAVAWEDEPATTRAIFARPDGVTAPKGKRRKGKPVVGVTNGAPTAP